ncbi:hypothetical protein Tco_0732002 [Tanacetum coccineum]
MEDPGLFTLPCRLGDSKPFDTLADLGSCVNIIPLYLFKKLNIGLLEETDHIFRKPKRVKDYAYHKEKMMLCKPEEKGVPLHAEQGDWLDDTDDERLVDSNAIPDSSDMCDDEEKADQNAENNEDEHVVLAYLIANLKFDTNENKKIQKQLKKANASLAHELNACKSSLEESNDIRDRCRSALHDQEIELEKYKKYKNCQIEKEEVERKLKETLGLLAQHKIDSNEALKTKAYEIFKLKRKMLS